MARFYKATPTVQSFKLIIYLALCLLYATEKAFAQQKTLTVTYPQAAITEDPLNHYDYAVLKLVLELTTATDGPFTLQASEPMNFDRQIRTAQQNNYTNLVIKSSYMSKLEQRHQLKLIPFPVELGIVGYRVCLLPKTMEQSVAEHKNEDDLKRFKFGQGASWADTEILRHNGFKVVSINKYSNLFRMTETNRFDLFCRGANEVKAELERNRTMTNLKLDYSFMLKYPLPRYFYTHKNNAQVQQRLHKGLLIAYRTGKLRELWNKHNAKSVEMSKLGSRKVYELKNPHLQDMDPKVLKQFMEIEQSLSDILGSQAGKYSKY